MRSHRDHLLGTCRQVVGSALGATLIGLSLLAGSATAAAILEPGDRVSLASADSCTQTIGDLSLLPPLDRELPASPPAPPGLVSASAACDQVARRLKAEVVTPAGVSLPGRFAAYTTLRHDFQVAASTGTTGDTVGAWVSFDVAWKGVVWATELTSNPAVELTLTLRDLTDAKIAKKATILSRDAKTIRFALPNVTDSGDALDSARVRDVLSAVLTRSHSYRVEFQLVCEVFQDATAPVASSTCDFKDAFPDGLDGAVTLDELSIKVGIDERDLLSQVAQLREDLATHTHIFLTGRGVGHNNTEAVTSPAILPAATNAASLRISPPSGVYGTTQQFDLQLVVTASGRTIVGARATLDGEDVTVPLGGCVIPGRLLPAGQTFRCPGLTGDLLSPGTHIFTVTLDFNDGTSVTRGVNWRVLTNTEP